MTLPNFLVIGAAKAGTTSLRRYLGQHPQIFVTDRGEPSFFAHEGEALNYTGPGDAEWNDAFTTNMEDYGGLFEGAESFPAVVDISPRYLYFERAPDRIFHHVPNAKVVAVLRHPVDRAYSHYLMNRGRDCEPAATLAEAIQLSDQRKKEGWGWDWRYVEAGLYAQQLERYYDRFDASQIKVFAYEDFAKPERFFAELFDFMDVDASFVPDVRARSREASLPRNRTLQNMLIRPNPIKRVIKGSLPPNLRDSVKRRSLSWNSKAPDPLAPDERQRLFEQYFAQDVRALEPMIGRYLDTWT